MGAAILCAIAGIDQAAVIPSTAAYLAHWRDALKGDNSLIIKAAAQAQKAVDLICGTTFEDEEEG
jgi:antirestriction protein ArdC